MRGFLYTLLLSLTLLAGSVLARPTQGDLLGRLLAIAEPDQVKAYEQLNLSPGQIAELRQAAQDFLPRVEALKGSTTGQFMLVPEALSRVDAILTPEQRPLARRLVPRAHQWAKLKALYHDYQN